MKNLRVNSFGVDGVVMTKVFHFFSTAIVLLFLVLDTVYGLTVFLVCDILLRLLLCIIRLPMTMFIFIAFMFSFISDNRYLEDSTSEIFGSEVRKLRAILTGGLAGKSSR